MTVQIDGFDTVTVLRQCRECGKWKTLGCFDRGKSHVCSACWHRKILGDTRGTIPQARRIAITDLGRADLARWRQEEKAS